MIQTKKLIKFKRMCLVEKEELKSKDMINQKKKELEIIMKMQIMKIEVMRI